MLEKENELLRERVGDLQKEHTLLIAKMGNAGQSGHDIIRVVMEEQAMNNALHRRVNSIGSKASRASEDSTLK